MKIPLLDLKAQYSKIKDEIKIALDKVLESQQLILGPEVAELENEICRKYNFKYAVGVSSGTDALLVSLMALGIKEGDLVITTPYSFFATVGVIVRLGAQPIFIDIEPKTYNLDSVKLEEYLRKKKAKSTRERIKAIIPIHLYGQCANMLKITELTQEYGIKIVEDAAQAIGSKWQMANGKWQMAGNSGELGCFSFFPSKNLGGYGDGGMVVTSNPDLAEKIMVLRVHGAKPKYYHSLIGGNFRLDTIQAAILLVKLKYLNEWTEKRRKNAEIYETLFKKNGLDEIVQLPYVSNENFHVYNQYIIRVHRRNELQSFLKEEGISTEVYYPVPLHLQPCLGYLGYKKGDFPESEKAANETLALPIYPELTQEQQGYIVSKIKRFYT